MKTLPTVIRAADLAAYAPANHTGTSNVRVIGPETVGATALEVLVGTIVKSHGAPRRPHLEQCAYMIEGTGESEAGRVEALGAGTWTYVPAGVFHSFRVTSDQPGRLLVVYAPPKNRRTRSRNPTPLPPCPLARGARACRRRRRHRHGSPHRPRDRRRALGRHLGAKDACRQRFGLHDRA